MTQIYRKDLRKVEGYGNFIYPDSINTNILPHLRYHPLSFFSKLSESKLQT